jgi:hypothetical protein
MQLSIWPQYLVEPQHIEGYIYWMWIVRPDVCRPAGILFITNCKKAYLTWPTACFLRKKTAGAIYKASIGRIYIN